MIEMHLLDISDIWREFSSTLQLVLKGLIVGIVISAPMGPVGILCIQRTMKKGRIYGIATGAGAALSDFFYALMTGLGMSFVIDFIEPLSAATQYTVNINGMKVNILTKSGKNLNVAGLTEKGKNLNTKDFKEN